MFYICSFISKKPYFLLNSPRIPSQTAVGADNPVTGNNNGNSVMSDRSTHCLCGHAS